MPDEPQMTAKDVVRLYDLFEKEEIKVWIDGGWAVDALLGRQTRLHADLDIALETRFLERLRALLAGLGFRQVPRGDTTPWYFVLGNGEGLEVDVHAFTYDEKGDGIYGPPEYGLYYRAEALTGEGVIADRPVRCISAEWLLRFHTGYELKDKDFHDIAALCEHFGLELPGEYRRALLKAKRIRERSPTVEEFLCLRADAGWRLPPEPAVRQALAQTLYAVCAEDDNGVAIGIGRVVGDGAVQFFITDVIVHSSWRNRLIGTAIMTALMDYINRHMTEGAFVGLFAAAGRQGFYDKFGFMARPTDTLGPGMVYIKR
ncbi:MAG TPA: GNAT family N-acetyltransferase [Firmicutes bacterium]|nr:GNAT family N-acetyltransferase [Bacillota bacterium]